MAEIGIEPFKTSIPDLDDEANIQTAFRYYHYGLPTEPTPLNPRSENSIQAHLERLQTSIDNITAGVDSVDPIISTTNLNNIVEAGTYHQGSTPQQNLNYPTLQPGLLIVAVAGTTIFQTYQTISGGTSTNNRLYVRSRSGTWGPWETFATADHLHDTVYYQKNEVDSRLDPANLTPANTNRVAIVNSSGRVTYSPNITTDELEFINGVTSNVQSQLNDRYRKSETARIFVSNPSSGNPTTTPQTGDLWFW